jgi:non-ribosomal peptide synthetase component F
LIALDCLLSARWFRALSPGRIRAVSECAALRIISMGGATEAAIWSNMHELHPEGTPGAVLSTDPNWTSIPYGRPLRNQTMLILDDNLHHCEPWVTGVIHIGGAGVALGYYEVPQMTSDCLR